MSIGYEIITVYAKNTVNTVPMILSYLFIIEYNVMEHHCITCRNPMLLIDFQFIFIVLWVLIYSRLLISVASGGKNGMETVFDKYTTDRKISKPNFLNVAGVCYLTKSLLALVVISLQGLVGFNFRAALMCAMTAYSLLLHTLLPDGPTLTTWLYLAGAVGLIVEWYILGAHFY